MSGAQSGGGAGSNNGIGNLSQLSQANGINPQMLAGLGGMSGFPGQQPNRLMTGPSTGPMAAPSTLPAPYTSAGNAGGMAQPPGGTQGWSPAFNQYPLGGATPANTQALYPQLSGGYWNQMAQKLAGPQYQSNSSLNAPDGRTPAPGTPTGGPRRGFAPGFGSNR